MARARYTLMLFLIIIPQILLLQVNSLQLNPSHDNEWIHRIYKRDAQAPELAKIPPVNNNLTGTDQFKCNGDARLCNLRYDQVTYPGTHNSASYDLRFDCNQTIRNCLDSASTCSKQFAQCVATYGMQCDAQTNTCKQWNPLWLHWICGGFDKVCKSSNGLCAAWNAVCTESGKVCNLWGDACETHVPSWAITCFWENNPGYPVSRQLRDGIRLFDFDTCLVNEERAVFCHGSDLTRALGSELDPIFQTILDFMNENPNEVITIEFGDTDGDPAKLGAYIQTKLSQYFINETGHSMMFSKTDPETPWPTLREMIMNNTRLVVFFGRLYFNMQERQPWIQNTGFWFTDSYTYTSNASNAQVLTKSFSDWCTASDVIILQDQNTFGKAKWQTIDGTIALILSEIKDDLKHGRHPGSLCLDELALSVNFNVLEYIATLCYPRFPYLFRVRIDHYWQSSLFTIVQKINERNIQRFSNNTLNTTNNNS
ncbi:10574_t:CDS:2 [Funneliformis caledonium]|uniref:10574_t:CDS:1 n=1 Tax=Funneliformis caledonium TaxID=1117310 RepID=A0A9N9AHB0_9GLOM|nr:10574_t:CDS:2 [Funneliformis caledonium]